MGIHNLIALSIHYLFACIYKYLLLVVTRVCSGRGGVGTQRGNVPTVISCPHHPPVLYEPLPCLFYSGNVLTASAANGCLYASDLYILHSYIYLCNRILFIFK